MERVGQEFTHYWGELRAQLTARMSACTRVFFGDLSAPDVHTIEGVIRDGKKSVDARFWRCVMRSAARSSARCRQPLLLNTFMLRHWCMTTLSMAIERAVSDLPHGSCTGGDVRCCWAM